MQSSRRICHHPLCEIVDRSKAALFITSLAAPSSRRSTLARTRVMYLLCCLCNCQSAVEGGKLVLLLTLTKRAKNERTKRNFFKNTLPAASDRAGCCHGHGLGLHPPLRRSHSHSYPGNTGHRSSWPASLAEPSQRHKAAPAAAFPPEAFPVS
ncbi:hypothetical protein C678_0153, partial [Clostridioides difficile F665]